MKIIYFVRHGESEANINIPAQQGVFQGIASPLTEKGREQARFIAKRCAKLRIDIILSSNAVRAHETALEIQRATGRPLEVHEMFVERMSPSSFLGKPRNDPQAKELLARWYQTFYEDGERVEDGESFADLKARVCSALRYLSERPEQHILVATHGFFLHMLIAVVLLGDKLSLEEFARIARKVTIGNSGLTQIEHLTSEDNKLLDEKPYEGWILRVWNDHAHLG